MSNSPSHDIALYLVSKGIGLFGGNTPFSIHEGGLPSFPDNAISVISSSGLGADTDELDIFQPGFQVLVRSLSKPEGYIKQELIRNLLIYPIPVDTPSSVFTQIDLVTDFVDIGQDESRRYIWSANYGSRRVLKPIGEP